MSQSEMAEALGLSLRYYQELEKGDKDASLPTIEKIIETLKIPVDRIFIDPRTPAKSPDLPRIFELLSQINPENYDALIALLEGLADQSDSLSNERSRAK